MKITKPRKADGAMFNTWIVDVDGTLNLYVGNTLKSNKAVITVRFTSEGHETLSITDERSDIQYTMPFKKIDELIKLARKEKKKELN